MEGKSHWASILLDGQAWAPSQSQGAICATPVPSGLCWIRNSCGRNAWGEIGASDKHIGRFGDPISKLRRAPGPVRAGPLYQFTGMCASNSCDHQPTKHWGPSRSCVLQLNPFRVADQMCSLTLSRHRCDGPDLWPVVDLVAFNINVISLHCRCD